MAQARQAHRNRVDEDDFVSRTRELAHEVGLGMRVVIPPVLAAKANDRTIGQQDIQDITGLTRSAAIYRLILKILYIS